MWRWGLDYGSSDFSIHRYDTAAHTDFRVDVNGNVAVSARLAAKNVALAHSALVGGATAAIDFDGDGFQTLTLTGDLAFTIVNLVAGRSKTIRILSDASPRTLTFPAGWRFVGSAAPSLLAVLRLTSFSTTEADVVATYSVEP